jgi:DNA-binding MarR family transcriptional regulator
MTESTSEPASVANSAPGSPRSRAWREFFEGSQLLKNSLERSLKSEAGLSLSDYNIMLMLQEHGEPLAMRQLADHLVFRPSRLTYAVHSLASRGLVVRQAAPADRRSVHVELSEKGRAAFRRAQAIHSRDVAALFVDHLDSEELETVRRVFNGLRLRLTEESD